MKIDPRAAIAPGAQLGAEVEVGPFAIIDENVIVGDGCKIGPHVHLTGHTTIGANTKIHAGAVIGDAPQDLHYNNEISYTDIGEDCVLREYVTIHRGTEEGSRTTVGKGVLMMAFSHLGHNCVIGDHVVIANASLLAGRVEVGPRAFISAGVMIHQFVRVGRLAMIGGGNGIGQDIPPFCMLQHEQIQGPNVVGLRRAGLSENARAAVRQAIKLYFLFGLSRMGAIERIRAEVPSCPEVEEFIDFVLKTKRGISPGRRLKTSAETTEATSENA
ncbi:MAG TPA: acyl-ACP--UDP-N-acetylglucosamine O-acyltransferase [Lentisphaeria bacterium]|nr:acyl-ACP--UDP-N-acetylglucosamine O-acyltransferase [Lentisphaerota bacterium]OQC13012.1 MAG: Acyl-(acyl-carrier-protein)--UDP-N-acetylglucosamine O-acyltransferase [Lentisphaerae bacterium ADurb.Bin082]HPY90099.1 acyl-ACP--UDP-N-acetylglucosamine O-acyltransferase [Lentisphaeria bacterium]